MDEENNTNKDDLESRLKGDEGKRRLAERKLAKIEARREELNQEKLKIDEEEAEIKSQIKPVEEKISEYFSEQREKLKERDFSVKVYREKTESGEPIFKKEETDQEVMSLYKGLIKEGKQDLIDQLDLKDKYLMAKARDDERTKILTASGLTDRVSTEVVVRKEKGAWEIYFPMKEEDQETQLFASMLGYVGEVALGMFNPNEDIDTNCKNISKESGGDGFLKFEILTTKEKMEEFVKKLREGKPEVFEEAKVDFKVSNYFIRNDGEKYATFQVDHSKKRGLNLKPIGGSVEDIPKVGEEITFEYNGHVYKARNQREGDLRVFPESKYGDIGRAYEELKKAGQIRTKIIDNLLLVDKCSSNGDGSEGGNLEARADSVPAGTPAPAAQTQPTPAASKPAREPGLYRPKDKNPSYEKVIVNMTTDHYKRGKVPTGGESFWKGAVGLGNDVIFRIDGKDILVTLPEKRFPIFNNRTLADRMAEYMGGSGGRVSYNRAGMEGRTQVYEVKKEN